MAKVSIDTFAEMTGIERKNLMVYIKRNKVIVDKETGLIDTNHDFNVTFYNRREAKGKIKGAIPVTPEQVGIIPKRKIKSAMPVTPEPAPQPKRRTPDPEDDVEDDEEIDDGSGLMPLTKSEKLYQHYRAERNRLAAELAELQIKQKQANLVEIEAVIPLFQEHNRAVMTETQALMEAQLRFLAKEFDIKHERQVEIRGKWTHEINRMMERAREATKQGIQAIVSNVLANQ